MTEAIASAPQRSSLSKDLLKILGIALAYFLAHQIAFFFPDQGKVIMLIWPAGGIGLAAFLLNPWRLWPVLTLAFYVAGVSADVLLGGRSLATGIGYMTGNMVESIGCAWIILRVSGGIFRRFNRVNEVMALIVSTIFVNAISSCIGAGTSVIARGAQFSDAWRSWYVSDGLGILLIGPFFVAWSNFKDTADCVRPNKIIETVVCYAAWVAFVCLIFGGSGTSLHIHPYLLVALVLWPALRLGQRDLSAMLILLFFIAVASPLTIAGPFLCSVDDLSPTARLLDLQVFLGIIAVVGYFIAAAYSELKISESTLLAQNKFSEALLESVGSGVVACDAAGKLILFNRTARQWHGLDSRDIPQSEWAQYYDLYMADGMTPMDNSTVPLARAFRGETLRNIDMVIAAKGQPKRHVTAHASPVKDAGGIVIGAVAVMHDVSEQKRLEEIRAARLEVMRICSSARDVDELIRSLTGYFHIYSGCEAVGVRLKDGYDFPYYETRGFPEEFVRMENRLCSQDDKGEPVRDSAGDPVIECMCGNVICGRFDASKPFFTRKGSFWTNCTTDLLASTTEADRQSPTRNRCNGSGYESVALVPLRISENILGLIQFNDKRKGRFTLDRILLYEELAETAASSIAKLEAESALKESEERFKAIFNCAFQFTGLVTVGGVLIEANQAALDFIGARQEDVVNRLFWETPWVAGDAARVNRLKEAVARAVQGKFVRYEERLQGIGRSEIIVDFSLKPIFGAYGKVTMLIPEARDITESKRIEDALRESEAKFRHLAESSPNMIFINCGGRVVYANRKCEEIMGYRAQEFYAPDFDFTTLIYPDDISAVRRNFSEHQHGREVPPYEYRLLSKEGKIIYAILLTKLIDFGGHKAILGSVTDISERRIMEDALRESQSRLEMALVASKAGTWDWNIVSGSIAWSKGLFELFGLDGNKAEAGFDAWRKIVHPDDLKDAEERIDKAIKDGVPLNSEYRIVYPSGEVRWVISVGAASYDNKHQPVRMAGICMDIDSRKRSEQLSLESAAVKAAAETDKKRARELEEAYAELKRTQDMFVQSEKMAALGEMSAGVAHELNNPLTGILGIARHYLEHKDPKDKEHGDLAQIVKAGEHVSAIIKELLNFSKPSSGELEKLDCNRVIDTVIEFSKKGLGFHDIDVRRNYEKDLPAVKGDRVQLQQVIFNIIDNSMYAMRDKGVFEITTQKVSIQGTPFVEMEFKDSGTGIREEDLSKIFDPFFTTKRPGKGTGLGLAVVYSIIKRHGGSITVKSPPEGQAAGTSFKILIPAATGA